MTNPKNLRIKALHVENFKGLAKLDLYPGANLIIVSGRNGAGKSSALDAAWWVLDSKKAGKEIKNPIRDGADKTKVVLEVSDEQGDLVMTMTKTQARDKKDPKKLKAAKLTIVEKGGGKKGRPSEFLGRMVDPVSLDPMEFTRAKPKDRLKMLMDVVTLPFDPQELDDRHADAYAERTDVNRDLKRLEARLEAMPEVDEDAPEAVSVADLLSDHAEAARRRDKADDLRDRLGIAFDLVRTAEVIVLQAEKDLADAREKLSGAEGNRDGLKGLVETIPANLVDPATIKARIDSAEATNLAAGVAEQNAKERTKLTRDIGEAKGNAMALTTAIDAVKKEREDGMAKAKFPVPGLGFTADGVTFNGKPFEDCCTGEQWRCAVGIVMARDPQIHVLRIKDGSLLDDEALKTLDEMCKEHDWDALVEVVTGGDLEFDGVVIEEGGAE